MSTNLQTRSPASSSGRPKPKQGKHQSGSGVPPLNPEPKQTQGRSAPCGSGVPPLNSPSESKKRQDAASTTFTPEQLEWLNLIRDHIATSLSIEPEDLELSPFNQRGGLGKAHQLFVEQLPKLLDELNEALVA
ncbi:MAG: type restriction endonuclease subunit [Pedosphaera sp.]|nr:type restriction endonuclease subunit [Pedosphaera sp.]